MNYKRPVTEIHTTTAKEEKVRGTRIKNIVELKA